MTDKIIKKNQNNKTKIDNILTNNLPELNNNYYDKKKKIRSKITQLLKNENFTKSDEYVHKTKQFNNRIILSLDCTLSKINNNSKNFRFEKNDRFDKLKNIYIDTSNIVKNQLNPGVLLKKHLDKEELDFLKNDLNYFIKDPRIKEKVNFLESKSLAEKLKEEEKQISINRRRNVANENVIERAVFELKYDQKEEKEEEKEEENLKLFNPHSRNNKIIYKKTDVYDYFDSKLKSAKQKVIQNKTFLRKFEKTEQNEDIEKILNNMTINILKINKQKNYESVSFDQKSIDHQSYLNIKDRQHKNIHKYNNGNKNEMEDKLIKKKIERIKENFLMTHVHK